MRNRESIYIVTLVLFFACPNHKRQPARRTSCRNLLAPILGVNVSKQAQSAARPASIYRWECQKRQQGVGHEGATRIYQMKENERIFQALSRKASTDILSGPLCYRCGNYEGPSVEGGQIL